MIKNDSLISVVELRRLLFSLRDLRPDICMRFRLLGEMWQINHLRILQLTEKGAVLTDEKSSKLLLIHDINDVVQFEIDHSFQQYQAHFHYSVHPGM